MSGQRCVLCGKPFRDAQICGGCERGFERTVAEIPALSDELDLTITRQTAIGSRNGSRATETPLAFNLLASTVAEELKATLVGWVRDLEPNLTEQPADSVASIGRWLLYRMPAVRQHDAVEQLVDEITYAVRAAWRAVDRPPNRSRVKVDDCLEIACLGELYAVFPIADYDPDDETTHAKMTCDACQITYPAMEWVSVGRKLLARAS